MFTEGFLTFNDERLIRLDLEISFLMDYIFLFQIRFGSNLNVEYDIPDAISEYYIVPFALQMLVENAIKHNVISYQKPLTIKIMVDEDTVTVSNNLQKRSSGVISTSTGLNNIITRNNLVIDREVVIDSTENDFRISVPIIDKRAYESINHRR